MQKGAAFTKAKKLSSTNTKSKSSAKHIVKLRGLNSIVFQKSYEKSYNDFHNILTNLSYVIISCGYGMVSSQELDAARKIIKYYVKRKGRIHIRAFPYLALTKKPSEVRMGKGKGTKINKHVAPIRPGTVLIEVELAKRRIPLAALIKAASKFSVSAIVKLNIRKIKDPKRLRTINDKLTEILAEDEKFQQLSKKK